MSTPRLRVRQVLGGFVVERPGLYVFDTDREETRAWAEALERAAAQHRHHTAVLRRGVATGAPPAKSLD